jgi:hypothetical protein
VLCVCVGVRCWIDAERDVIVCVCVCVCVWFWMDAERDVMRGGASESERE